MTFRVLAFFVWLFGFRVLCVSERSKLHTEMQGSLVSPDSV